MVNMIIIEKYINFVGANAKSNLSDTMLRFCFVFKEGGRLKIRTGLLFFFSPYSLPADGN
jgi:hypothetical protein